MAKKITWSKVSNNATHNQEFTPITHEWQGQRPEVTTAPTITEHISALPCFGMHMAHLVNCKKCQEKAQCISAMNAAENFDDEGFAKAEFMTGFDYGFDYMPPAKKTYKKITATKRPQELWQEITQEVISTADCKISKELMADLAERYQKSPGSIKSMIGSITCCVKSLRGISSKKGLVYQAAQAMVAGTFNINNYDSKERASVGYLPKVYGMMPR